jgi:hypothetical protein
MKRAILLVLLAIAGLLAIFGFARRFEDEWSVNWVLMLPPPAEHDGQYGPNSEAPLSEWMRASYHETARDCEQEKISAYSDFKRQGDAGKAAYYVQAQCVPAKLAYAPKLGAEK